jgi:uncharacterized membrane protein
LSLAVGGALLRFGSGVWLGLSLAALWATQALTPPPEQAAIVFHPAQRLLLIPGHSGFLMVLYPLIPWFALAGLGVLFARALRRDPRAGFRAAPWIGGALLLAALGLRAAGGFGNLRPPRDGSWIEFLNLVKYPPALVFSFFMVGANLVALGAVAGSHRLATALAPLAVFGRSPLFFYLAHLYFYAALGALFFRQSAGLPAMVAVWLAGLVPLWFLCRRYRRFKQGRPPQSIWRFL